MTEIRNSVAIVTGGARGMGASHARELVARGGRVVIADVLRDEGEALARELGENCRFSALDITSSDEWANTLALAESAFGPVNILINNAGVVGRNSVQRTSPEEFRKIIDVNVTGTFNGIHVVADSMKRAGGGVIINISSTAGMIGFPDMAPYVASKWAVRGLTKAAALDLARDGIRVNSIHPGAIRTIMAEGVPDGAFAGQPVPRIGEIQEITDTVIYLIGADFVTGAEFVVDGGAILIGPDPLIPRDEA